MLRAISEYHGHRNVRSTKAAVRKSHYTRACIHFYQGCKLNTDEYKPQSWCSSFNNFRSQKVRFKVTLQSWSHDSGERLYIHGWSK